MDLEVSFKPDLNIGVTAETNRKYLKLIARKGFLWEVSEGKRILFKNRFDQQVAENIRRIKPLAPDKALEEIAEMLRREALS